MKNKSIILLGIFTYIFFACQNKNQRQAPPPPQLPIIKAELKNLTTYSEYPTQLEGVVSSDIRAKVPGYITNVMVEEGTAVKKGEILFKLETESLSGDASSARAQVNAAQIEVNKLKPLVDKEIVSEMQLQTAQAQLETAKSDLKSIAANVNYATIKSPVNGFIGTINFREGALINPSDIRPLTRVVKTKEVFAYFSVNEKDFLNMSAQIRQNSVTNDDLISSFPEVTLVLSNGEEYDKKGEISSISSQVNRETGTLRFRATFDNVNGILKDGFNGKIKIPNYSKNAIVVPRISTFSRQGKEFVFKLNASDSTVVEKAIEVTKADPYYIVNSGLKKGEKIVGQGVNKIKNRDKIIPKSSTMDSIVNSFDKVFK